MQVVLDERTFAVCSYAGAEVTLQDHFQFSPPGSDTKQLSVGLGKISDIVDTYTVDPKTTYSC